MVAESDYLHLVTVMRQQHGITRKEIESTDRSKRGLFGRHVIALCLRQQGYSLTEIGQAIGRNHTTVLRLLNSEARQYESRQQMRKHAHAEAARIATGLPRHIPPTNKREQDSCGSFLPLEHLPQNSIEKEYQRAVEAYAAAAVYERETVWKRHMQLCFPHSWKKQVLMPPRLAA